MVTFEFIVSRLMEIEVLQISEKGVHTPEQQALLSLVDKINWHDLNMLRHLADAPSLRQASRSMGVSINTIRARLDRLEKALGTTLFARTREGLRITAEGRSVFRIASDMRLLGTELPQSRGHQVLVSEGEVRVCASEGVGTFWLTPRLPALKSRLPEHVVTLDCFSDQARVAPEGYDIAVGFQKPEAMDMVCARLATIHVMPFASEQYIRQYGLPVSLDDVDGHQFIEQNSPGHRADAINVFLTEDVVRRVLAIRVSSSFSLYWAVVNGVGIGALPTYARIITRRVRPINLPIQLRFDLWLSYRLEARRSPPIQRAVEWLRESFDAQQYPWFSERFVHPDAFSATHEESHVVPLFDQMSGGL